MAARRWATIRVTAFALLWLAVCARAENYAVLFSGGGGQAENYPRYYANQLRFYNLVVGSLNFRPENVWVVCSDGTDPAADVSDGTNSDWSAAVSAGSAVLPATAADLQAALAATGAASADLLLLWTFDHGAGLADRPDVAGEETLTGWGESIADEQLALWAGQLQAGRQAFVYSQCFAGGMLDNLNIAAGSGRFGCAAANHYEPSYDDGFVDAFSDGLEHQGHTTTHALHEHAYANDPYATDGEGPGGTYADGVEHPWKVGDDLDLAVAKWVGLGAGGASNLWTDYASWSHQPNPGRTVRIEFSTPGSCLVNTSGRRGGYVSVDSPASVAADGYLHIAAGGELGSTHQVIGDGRCGRVRQQGGQNAVSGDVILGRRAAQGVYDLEGGDLSAATLYVGAGGSGTLTQTGGTNAVSGELFLGRDGAADGTYQFADGGLSADYERIGYSGRGQFTQTGGSHVVGTVMTLGYYPGSEGRYDLAGGELSCPYLNVGNRGTAVFAQAGGTHTVANNLYITRSSGGRGTYTLSGGALHVAGKIRVGFADTGTFSLNGGAVDADAVEIYGGGTLAASAGGLVVADLHVGYDGAGAMALAGPAAGVTVTRRLRFGPSGTFAAVAGSTIHMTGAPLENESTDAARLAGLANLTLIFEGGPAVTDTVEVAGQDLGAVPAGWSDNFALGTLQLGGSAAGRIGLADDFDNQPGWVGDEALYTGTLVMNAGAVIDPNGLSLYYLNGGEAKQFFSGDANLDGTVNILDLGVLANSYGEGGKVWAAGDFNGDGEVNVLDLGILANHYGSATGAAAGQPIPEPATLTLLAVASAGVLAARRRV